MAQDRRRTPEQNRAQKTRQRLVDAALSLISRSDGAVFPSTADIARDAGVAIGSFYRYFPTAESVVLEAFDEAHDHVNARWFEGLPAQKGQDTKAQADAFFSSYCACATSQRCYIPLLKLARQTRSVSDEMALSTDPPDAVSAFASIFDIAPTQANLSALRLLKFVTQQLMALYLLADDSKKDAIGAEVKAYTQQALDRLQRNQSE